MTGASLMRGIPMQAFGSDHEMTLWAFVGRQRREGPDYQY
jgi:hypothetical protein